jgi:ATP-dependent DNA helicase DinG
MLTAERLTAHDVLADGGVISEHLPGYAERPGQLELAAAIETAIADGTNLVAEAGTGVGKSLAYLVPAILSGKQTTVATATKVLQDQLWSKDIPNLARWLPVQFSAAILKGRVNYVCLDQLAGRQPQLQTSGESAAWASFHRWHDDTETGDLDSWEHDDISARNAVLSGVTVTATECHGKACHFARQCWSEKARNDAREADVVIANHHLLVMSRCTEAKLLPLTPVTIVDECHHLEDVASNVLGAKLTPASWTVLRNRVATVFPKDDSDEASDAYDELNALGDAVTDAFATLARRVDSTYNGSTNLPDHTTTYEAVRLAAHDILYRLRVPFERETEDQAAKRQARAKSIAEYLHKLWLIMVPEDGVVRYAEVSGREDHKRLTFYARYVDVSEHLRHGIWELDVDVPTSAIAVSATVAAGEDFDPWMEAVGAEQTATLLAPSPFKYRQNALLYLPDDAKALTPPGGDRDSAESRTYYRALAAEMLKLVAASEGRAFLLFTSYAAMNAVVDEHIGRPEMRRLRVFRQGDAPPRQLITSFLAAQRGVLYGTRSFWEGVDIPGAALSLVVIDKLPFSAPGDPVWDAKVEAVKLNGGDWFRDLALPYCITTLKQGVGRLIRTTTDRGVMAILDGRLVTKGYGGRILRALPPATRTRSIEDVRDFFQEALWL